MEFIGTHGVRLSALAILLSWGMSIAAHGQLKCKTKTDAVGQTETCLHATGQVSTVRFWESDDRNGMFEAFRSDGSSLAKYDLRKFAGHASVYVTYFPNGQVKALEYSSAPDGGIQFWHIIHHFDEQGTETWRQDLSQPDGHPHVMVPKELLPETPQHVVPRPVVVATPAKVMVTKEITLIDLSDKTPVVHYQWAGDSVLHQVKWPSDGAPAQLGKYQLEESKAKGQWIQFKLTGKDNRRYEIVSTGKTEWAELFVVRRRKRGRD